MSSLDELAARDAVAVLAKGARLAGAAVFDTTCFAVITFCFSRFTHWYIGLPTDFKVPWYPYARIMHAIQFLQMKEFKEWFSEIKTLFTRDAPPDGLAGVEIASVITKGLLLLFYVIFSWLLYNLWAPFSFLYQHKIWILGILAGLLALIFIERLHRLLSGERNTGLGAPIRNSLTPLLTLPFIIGFAVYNLPLRGIELSKNGWSYFAAALHPVLELYYFRRPSTLYRYKPLNAKKAEIRLIRIHRRLPGANIRCDFVHVSINKVPEYEAISYTWGLGGKDHLAFFEGHWLPTTRNVHKILQERSSYMRTRWVWIDAVCIDQENLDEKSNQVEMMGRIYQAAQRAIVWLDDQIISHSELTDASFLLELINFNSIDLSKDLYDPPTRVVGQRNHWEALDRLLSHPYWHRVWIVQEVAMAKKVHLLYGNRYISWDQLSAMIAILLRYPISVLPTTASMAYKMDVSRILRGAAQVFVISVVRDGVQRAELYSFTQCISMTQRCNSTDPRDKIFALKNLVKQTDDPSDAESIEVDYKLDVQDVYTHFARYILKNDAHFILALSGIGWQRKTIDLPSWVPDFQSLPPCTPEHEINPEARFKAGLSGAIVAGQGEISNRSIAIIKVQAVVISEISSLSVTTITIDATNDTSESVFSNVRNMAVLHQESWEIADKMPVMYAATGQPIVEAFWRTLIEDRSVIEGTPVAQYKHPAAPEYGFYFMACREALFRGENPSIQTSGMEGETGAFQYRASFNLARAFGRVWQERRFAATSSGLMGVVPPRAEVGDLLCVIPGFERPVLLRRTPQAQMQGTEYDEEFEFVGTCYAHGIMSGEALRGAPSIEILKVR